MPGIFIKDCLKCPSCCTTWNRIDSYISPISCRSEVSVSFRFHASMSCIYCLKCVNLLGRVSAALAPMNGCFANTGHGEMKGEVRMGAYGGSRNSPQDVERKATPTCQMLSVHVCIFKSQQDEVTYTKGGDGLDHGGILGRRQGLVGGSEVTLPNALTRAQTALVVKSLGRHLGCDVAVDGCEGCQESKSQKVRFSRRQSHWRARYFHFAGLHRGMLAATGVWVQRARFIHVILPHG